MLGGNLEPGDLFEAPSAASPTDTCRANPLRHLELWQLAFCSGSLFKMGVFKSHGNVRSAEALYAAGKIFPWGSYERALTR